MYGWLVNLKGGIYARSLFDIIRRSHSESGIVLLERLDGFNIEALESVRLQVGRNKNRQFVEAVRKIQDRVARQLMHGAVVPDVGVHAEEATGAHAVLEKADRLILLAVQFVNVYTQDERAGGDLGRLVLKERGLIELELADLEGHFEDDLVVVVIEDSQEPFERLYGALEIEVEAEA